MIIAVDGEDHKTLRKLHGRDLPKSLVDEHAGGLVALTRRELEEACREKGLSAIDLTRTLISRQVHHLLSDGAEPVSEETVMAMLETFRWETNTLLLGKWPKIALRHPKYRRFRRRSQAFLDDLIETCKTSVPPGWFATVMRGREQHPRLFTTGDVRMDFMLPFVAGVDTVGATLASLLGELLRHPQLLHDLVDQVVECWPDREKPPSVESLRGIDSLYGAVLETLRLHPSAFAVYRQAAYDFNFSGYDIPAGADVLLFTTATHADKRYFRAPEVFDVTRYAPPREEHRQPFVHMPYGAGPHICLGAGLGESLLLLGAATVVRFFEVRGAGLEHVGTHRYDPSLVVDRRFEVTLCPRLTAKSSATR